MNEAHRDDSARRRGAIVRFRARTLVVRSWPFSDDGVRTRPYRSVDGRSSTHSSLSLSQERTLNESTCRRPREHEQPEAWLL